MKFISLVGTLLAFTLTGVRANPVEIEPRYITTSTQYGGICYTYNPTATTTSTQPGVTVTTPNPGTSTITEKWANLGTTTIRVAKREQTTVLVTNICQQTQTMTHGVTVTDAKVTATVPSYQHTATATEWIRL